MNLKMQNLVKQIERNDLSGISELKKIENDLNTKRKQIKQLTVNHPNQLSIE